jgi:hypothetical protein
MWHSKGLIGKWHADIFRGRLVKEAPRVFASLWRKTLEALAEDVMMESNERRIFVVVGAGNTGGCTSYVLFL